ncbi:MAG: hypothetical protein WA790_15840 [Sulfitobacter sp.]
MTSIVFNLPTSGAETKVATKEDLDGEVNRVIVALSEEFAQAISNTSLAGSWDVSSGLFPSGALNGTYYIADGSGTVGGEEFATRDLLFPLLDGASTTVYDGNWSTIPFSTAIAAEVDAARVAAEEAAALSLSHATQASQYSTRMLQDVSAVIEDSGFTYTPSQPESVAVGDYIITRKEGYSYRVAPVVAIDHHITTQGGVRLYVQRGDSGYDLMAFGAKNDLSEDASVIAGKWVDAILSGGLRGHIPAGKFLLNSLVLRSVATVWFAIAGEGAGISQFYVPETNTDGGLWIASTARDSEATYRDFDVITRGQGGIGLAFTQPEGGAQHKRNLTCQNIAVKGENSNNDWFDTFVSFKGTWRPFIDNLTCSGPWVGVDNSEASYRFDPAIALNLDGCYDWTVTNSYFWGASTLIRSRVYVGNITTISDNGDGTVRCTVSSSSPFSTGSDIFIAETTDYNGSHEYTRVSATQFDITATYVSSQTGKMYAKEASEAWRLTNTVTNGGKIGLDVYRPGGREPIGWITNCHSNCRDENYRVDGAKLVKALSNDLYNEDLTEQYAFTPHDFNLKNVSEYIVTNNTFHFSGHSSRIGVFAESDTTGEGDNGIVAHNIFSGAFDYAVWLTSGVTGVTVGPNAYSGTFVTGHVNDVANNNYIVDQATQTKGAWTPVLAFDGASTGITYGAQSARYSIQGDVMFYWILIKLTSKGTATGTATISLPTSLPGPLGIQKRRGSASVGFYAAMASVSTSPSAYPSSATALTLTRSGMASIVNLADTNFTNTSAIELTGQLWLA